MPKPPRKPQPAPARRDLPLRDQAATIKGGRAEEDREANSEKIK